MKILHTTDLSYLASRGYVYTSVSLCEHYSNYYIITGYTYPTAHHLDRLQVSDLYDHYEDAKQAYIRAGGKEDGLE